MAQPSNSPRPNPRRIASSQAPIRPARIRARRLACAFLAVAIVQLASVASADAARLAIRHPKAGSTVSGHLRVAVKVKGKPRAVVFYVDKKRKWVDRKAPYRYRRGGLDTSRLRPGRHRITVKARYRRHRKLARASVKVRVAPRSSSAASAPAGLLWSSDFEGGLTPPWVDVNQTPGKTQVATTTEQAFEGQHALKATVNGGSSRAEVSGTGSDVNLRRFTEGEELYFAHSVLYPKDFPATQEGFCVNMQLHTKQRGDRGKSPALTLSCRDGDTNQVMIRAQSSGGCEWKKPMERGVWHSFVWRVKFSSGAGSWDLWYRRAGAPGYEKVVSGCPTSALLSPSDYSYMKVGLYRSLRNTQRVSVFHDAVRMGTSFESVAG
jgi:hypothetical protein